MIFFHGTSIKNWQKIKLEGKLFGVRDAGNRCTYLAVSKKEAKCYGKIILKVDYDPYLHPKMNNFIEGCWQYRVYESIKNFIRL